MIFIFIADRIHDSPYKVYAKSADFPLFCR